jgi:hypothetical protein
MLGGAAIVAAAGIAIAVLVTQGGKHATTTAAAPAAPAPSPTPPPAKPEPVAPVEPAPVAPLTPPQPDVSPATPAVMPTVLQIEPKDARVELDGKAVRERTLPLVKGRTYKLRVSAPRRVTVEREIVGGAEPEIVMTLEKPGKKGAPPVDSQQKPGAPKPPGDPKPPDKPPEKPDIMDRDI